MNFARRPWFILIVFGALVVASRYPLAPGQLFSFDDVNLAHSVRHFDIRISQPQPPGYPLFVMEMRALWWLRFRRMENLLLALSLAGSIAALFLIGLFGNRMLGGISGYCAAWLMALHPVFWYSGVTSALRVQLAIVAVAAAAACWRAWRGDGRWVLWSAVALGLGAGIRPEAGPLLFPLWVASALRAPVAWKDRAIALGAMAASVAVWLLPAMMASGGPYHFVKACLEYVTDQASGTSGLFGATETRWRTTFWHLTTWVFCGVPGFLLPAALAWRRKEWWKLGWERLAFFALWLVPAFVFALLVHVEDSGQALLMVPAVSLAGGHLMNRALDLTDLWISRWHALIVAIPALVAAWTAGSQDKHLLAWVPAVCLAAGLMLRLAPVKNLGYPPRSHVMALLTIPALLFNFTLFTHHGWYFRGAATSGLRAVGEHALADVNSALAFTSLEQIRATLSVDDHSLRQVRRVAAERPGAAMVVWEHGLTAWRKAAYYEPDLPIVVLEHQKMRSGPPVISIWRGPKLEKRTQGAAPLRVSLPAGTRIVWLLNPTTDFFKLAQRNFSLTQAEPVYYTDLPRDGGSRILGEYELVW